MHQPVTDNAFVIMVINMTIVFAVLIAVWALIEITHWIDPTKKKAAPAPSPAAPAAAPASSGLSAEIVAVIAAAVTACGCSAAGIRAIRPAERSAWKSQGRTSGLRSS